MVNSAVEPGKSICLNLCWHFRHLQTGKRVSITKTFSVYLCFTSLSSSLISHTHSFIARHNMFGSIVGIPFRSVAFDVHAKSLLWLMFTKWLFGLVKVAFP
ncbi:hypothetical protein ACH5RR_002498 [Cinchona calisaya]|uniref:Uncharacterized protein n=1 Tax=Cinchona calisaya TaxID=153742 RepID=A0ABD3B6D1_9GENT